MAKPRMVSVLPSALLFAASTGLRAIDIAIPNAIILFCLAIVWSARRGGTVPGLIAAAAGMLDAILDSHGAGGLSVHHPTQLYRLFVPLIGLPLLAILAVRLRGGAASQCSPPHPGRSPQGITLCAWCRRARAKDGRWEDLENVLHHEHGLSPSHGICPDCAPELHHHRE